MDITDIDLFDLNVGMNMCQSWTQIFMDITSIDLFDQNVGMVCSRVGLRCSWISLVLINLI